MRLADQKNELAPKGFISLVIYPRQVEAGAVPRALDKPPRRRWPWLSSLLVFLLSAGVTFAAVYMRELWSRKPLPTAQLLQGVFPSEDLGLRVEYQGERLLLTWNRASPAVRSAAKGILRIDDGGRHRDLLIDPIQLVAGSLLYKPGSDDVSFRLEVQSDQGKRLVETIRVLDPSKPPSTTSPAEKPEPSGPAASQPSRLWLPGDRRRRSADRTYASHALLHLFVKHPSFGLVSWIDVLDTDVQTLAAGAEL